MPTARITRVELDVSNYSASVWVSRDFGEAVRYDMPADESGNWWFQTPPSPVLFYGLARLLFNWLIEKGYVNEEEVDLQE